MDALCLLNCVLILIFAFLLTAIHHGPKEKEEVILTACPSFAFFFFFFFLMRFRHVVRYPIHNESGDICCVVLHGRFPGQRCKALSSFFFLRQKLTYY